MFSISLIADAISEDVNRGLAAAGYPKLKPFPNGKPGRIIVGEPSQYDEFLPPRIIFRPSKTEYGPRSNGMGPCRFADNALGPDAQRLAALAQRAIFTETHTFDVYVASLAPANQIDATSLSDYDRIDYEYTRATYLQLIASCQLVMPGNFGIDGGGTWEPKRHLDRIWREFRFSLGILLPVLAELVPIAGAPYFEGQPAIAGLPFAPDDVVPNITDTLITNPGVAGMPGLPDPPTIPIVDPGPLVSGPGCEE